ncbi:hypothetical protein GQ457_11G003620 [Hibiscus cannabinus]
MSAVDNSLAGLTLDDVLGKAKQAKQPPAQNKPKQAEPSPAKNKAKQSEPPPAQNKAKPPPAQNLALSDTVSDDTSTKEKKSWKLFREKFLLKKAAGSAWTSSIHIPASDVNVQGNRSPGRRTPFADKNHVDGGGGRPPAGKPRPQLARRTSVRYDNHDSVDSSTQSDAPPSKSLKPQNAYHFSTSKGDDDGEDDDDEDDDEEDEDEDEDDSLMRAPVREERSLSAREAVASQEAAEAAAKQEEAENNNGDEPVKMSLMDLLGESGSSYVDEDDESCEEEEEEEEEEEIVQSTGSEFTCCICNVNITSSAYMPCTHTFCRLCSKEFSVQRGYCPLCNGFVSEILDIF